MMRNLKVNMIIGLAFAFLSVVMLKDISIAIDNPDAPDHIGQFEAREKAHLDKINDPKNTNRGFLIAYDDYLIFLDNELNAAYKLLMSKLAEVQRKELRSSQREWIKFRDAEFDFIKNNWTRANFGSSAGIARGTYRSSIVKNRVIQLLQYTMIYQ